jgi:hypothetical protein
MLNIVGRFIYTKYWGILYVEHCGKIIYTKDWGLLYVEHCNIKYFPIYCVNKSSHSVQDKVLPNILCK